MSLTTLLIFFGIVNFSVTSDEVTFRNVVLYKSIIFFNDKITTIQSSNSLKENLPEEQLSTLFVTGRIPTLKKNSVSDITTVQDLHFIRNFMKKIEIGAFRNLDGVEKLVVTFNNLTSLENGVFENLPIRHLDLTHNQIKTVSKEAFKNMSNLNYLDMSHNEISAVPDNFLENLPNLAGILLNWNRITSISKGIFNDNPMLNQIQIEHNLINVIDPEAFDNISELANIKLGGNKLTKYDPRWFHNTPKIFRLFLMSNQIEEIPDEAFKNIYNNKSQWIRLDYNSIKKISPDAFKGFKNIHYLNLASNKIDEWNENFLEDAETLKYLNLLSNEIVCPEGDFDKVFKANFTYLGYNNLSKECVEKINKWSKDHPGKVVCPESCLLY